jgi:acetoacetate decarboxylase
LFEGPDNDIRPYWEFILEVPALFKKKPCNYVVQLYLGSTSAESSVIPVMSGQALYGFPKREAQYQVTDTFGHRYCNVYLERFGKKIADVTFEKLQAAPDPTGAAFYPNEPILMLKAIPKVDGDGWDV